MIIIGASGHAKDLVLVFEEIENTNDLVFFDDVTLPKPSFFLEKYTVLNSFEEIDFTSSPSFATALGDSPSRRLIAEKFMKAGGIYKSIVSKTAIIGNHNVKIGKGVNILPKVIISNCVSIGEGTLVNTSAQIHHDVTVGEYCDISPGALLLGYVKIGNNCSIGAGAIICPRVTLGDNITVGAGAVVVNDYPDKTTIVGIPAKSTQKKE